MDKVSRFRTLVSIVLGLLLACVAILVAFGIKESEAGNTSDADDLYEYAVLCGVGAGIVVAVWLIREYLWPWLNRHNHPTTETGRGKWRITGAQYGTHTDRVDVMPFVKSKVVHGVLAMTVTPNELGGDPAPGEAKTLYLTLRRGLKTEHLTYRNGTVFQVFKLRD